MSCANRCSTCTRRPTSRLPWSTIDMDFMNLNQAAHGDREFAHVQTRLGIARKTVAGHVSDPAVQRRIVTWMRACAGAAALRQLRMARFGDNMRNVAVTDGDKVEAEHRFGVSVNSYAVNDLVAVVEQVDDAAVDELVRTYLDLLRRGNRAASRGRAGAQSFATRPASRRACATSSTTGDFAGSRPTSRTSVACDNFPGSPCSA